MAGIFELPSDRVDPREEFAKIKADLREIARVISDLVSENDKVPELQASVLRLEQELKHARTVNEQFLNQLQELKLEVAVLKGKTSNQPISINNVQSEKAQLNQGNQVDGKIED
jgi:chromosome segregation ATPase